MRKWDSNIWIIYQHSYILLYLLNIAMDGACTFKAYSFIVVVY